MLKIKDTVALEELEKFGFTKIKMWGSFGYVYDFVKFKKIVAVKVGKMWKVTESELNHIKENGLRN